MQYRKLTEVLVEEGHPDLGWLPNPEKWIQPLQSSLTREGLSDSSVLDQC